MSNGVICCRHIHLRFKGKEIAYLSLALWSKQHALVRLLKKSDVEDGLRGRCIPVQIQEPSLQTCCWPSAILCVQPVRALGKGVSGRIGSYGTYRISKAENLIISICFLSW